ncbi:16S rRNA (guanine(527)-N(7))-methyltransferase RsmG [Paraburkholderia sp.]|uniref:16S rRNA (guanine(527)-N(7))-methyltransferase RsmG n=1 Tax=Paraburkholderia sp. TaxID=1926495 RepID=UPI00238709A1|nr:16S rRNA (guanine(527)-N(7))-methyltransferase RsmG [Paraburkholderia sp.]MDE1179308.1 16S rRNA (guanine(527)-N(7))-methyltransferase RsmG [Paraburkholderia sp.]
MKSLFKDARSLRQVYELSDACLARLDIYAGLLTKWQKTINLVAPSTLPELWERHFLDSLQVSEAVPQAKVWADLGSGGGFPGLVTAIRLADVPGAKMHLIESDQRKCAFLRTVSRENRGARRSSMSARIEEALKVLPPLDAISARGLAPLPQLVALAEKPLENARAIWGFFCLKAGITSATLPLPMVTGTFDILVDQDKRHSAGLGHSRDSIRCKSDL